MSTEMTTPETDAPDQFEHLCIALERTIQAQNRLRAAATLLRFSAQFADAESTEKRAKAARIDSIIGQLDAVADAVRDVRGFDRG